MNDRVSVAIKNHVADVRLARADKMNALDDAMFSALIETGERLKAENGVRAIVLSGEGRAFCAGLDMESLAKIAAGQGSDRALLTQERTPGGANRAQHAVMVWREQPVPVIAAVHGVAFGGGLQLALGADIRIAAPDARFAVMEIKWGLVPDMAGMALLRGLVRDDVARELAYTGRIFSGEEAVALGVATRVSHTPLAVALELAEDIANKSPHAVRAAKRLFALAAEAPQGDILRAESQEQAGLIRSPNQIEAVTANLEKRAPDFVD